MPLITVSSLKGGQTKSTTAAGLAAELDAPILDFDHRQGDSLAWARAAGHPCRVVLPDLAQELIREASTSKGWVVADCPPAESDAHRLAVFGADLVVVPLAPFGAQDARGWYRQAELLREAAEFRQRQGFRQVQVAFLNRYEQTAMAAAIGGLLAGWAAPDEGRYYLGTVAKRVAISEAYQKGLPPHRGRFGLQFAEVLTKIANLATAISDVSDASAHTSHGSIQ